MSRCRLPPHASRLCSVLPLFLFPFFGVVPAPRPAPCTLSSGLANAWFHAGRPDRAPRIARTVTQLCQPRAPCCASALEGGLRHRSSCSDRSAWALTCSRRRQLGDDSGPHCSQPLFSACASLYDITLVLFSLERSIRANFGSRRRRRRETLWPAQRALEIARLGIEGYTQTTSNAQA